MNRTCTALMSYGISSRKAQELSAKKHTVSQLKQSSEKYLEDLGLSHEQINALKARNRKAIPREVIRRLIYKSGYRCCFCRDKDVPIVIHHISPYHISQDNSEDNLVVLCPNHHSEAHTQREITQSMTPDVIKHAKDEWEKEVARSGSDRILKAAKGYPLVPASWLYFNHRKISTITEELGINTKNSPYYEELLSVDLIDFNGFVTSPTGWREFDAPVRYLYNFDISFSPYLHKHYKFLLHEIIRQVHIVDITNQYNQSDIESVLREGDFYICQGAHYFRREEHRHIGYRRANKVTTEFILDPFEFTSDSASLHLSGRSRVTVFGLVRNISRDRIETKVRTTPLGICTGMNIWQNHFGSWTQFDSISISKNDFIEGS